jgi:hypothetical protein
VVNFSEIINMDGLDPTALWWYARLCPKRTLPKRRCSPAGATVITRSSRTSASGPFAVYRFYNDRAAVELIIKELKADYPLAKIPTASLLQTKRTFTSCSLATT